MVANEENQMSIGESHAKSGNSHPSSNAIVEDNESQYTNNINGWASMKMF